MKNFRCKLCGAEYDTIPVGGCTAPGCCNTNPAMFKFIGNTLEPPKPDNHEKEEKIYHEALLYDSSDHPDELRKAKELFASIPYYRDSAARMHACEQKLEQIRIKSVSEEKEREKSEADLNKNSKNNTNNNNHDPKSIYQNAQRLYALGTSESLSEAKALFSSIIGYKNADAMVMKCLKATEKLNAKQREKTYREAILLASNKKYLPSQREALNLFTSISGYKNADKLANKCEKRIQKLEGGRKTHPAVIVLLTVLLIGALGAGVYLLIPKSPPAPPSPDPTIAPTISPAPDPTVKPTTIKPSQAADVEVDEIAFYRRPTKGSDFFLANGCLYSDDYQCKVAYFFKDVENIPGSTSVKAVYRNEKKEVITKKTTYFKDLDSGSNGWSHVFSQGDLSSGKLIIEIYSEDGELLAQDSIKVLASSNPTEPTVKPVPDVDIEVDEIVFYKKTYGSNDFEKALGHINLEDKEYGIGYYFKNIKNIPQNTSINVIISNPIEKTIKNMTLSFDDLDSDDNGWITRLSPDELTYGTLNIYIYSEDGSLLKWDAIFIEKD